MTPVPGKLPIVLATSVIRGTEKGMHGGVYLVDLESGKFERVLDWNKQDIDWSGRGGARGMRGVATYGDEVYLAASDEIFIYDKHFNLLESHRNPYLNLCHEIFISQQSLFLTSTGYNAVLEFDMRTKRFVRGFHARMSRGQYTLYRRGLPVWPLLEIFDPEKPAESLKLVAKESLHINNVYKVNEVLYFSGTRARNIFSVSKDKLSKYGRVPFGAHNARPHKDGILVNDTAKMRLAFLDRAGHCKIEYPVKIYPHEELQNIPPSQKIARQGFARGLIVIEDELLIAGSSPATINIFQPGRKHAVKTVKLTMDVRNAIHGLAIWPF